MIGGPFFSVRTGTIGACRASLTRENGKRSKPTTERSYRDRRDGALYGGEDLIDGGDGEDWLVYGPAAVTVDLGTGWSYERGSGYASDRIAHVENVSGSPLADEIYGDDANSVLRGRGGNDVLEGRGGVDVLDGGKGGDVCREEEGTTNHCEYFE
jgi:Ca2+-binding RTX toxin-like protein